MIKFFKLLLFVFALLTTEAILISEFFPTKRFLEHAKTSTKTAINAMALVSLVFNLDFILRESFIDFCVLSLD